MSRLSTKVDVSKLWDQLYRHMTHKHRLRLTTLIENTAWRWWCRNVVCDTYSTVAKNMEEKYEDTLKHNRQQYRPTCKPSHPSTATIRLQGGPKNWHTFLYALTSYALASSNIDRFINLFHCLNQENILIILLLKISPHLKCVVTLPCEMSVS